MSLPKKLFGTKRGSETEEKGKSKYNIPLDQLYDTNRRIGEIQGSGESAPTASALGSTFVQRPIVVNAKLTIILIENTAEVAKEEEKLKAIVKKLVQTGYICVINYGTVVRKGVIAEASDFDSNNLICKEFAGDNACLFDAIDALEEVVNIYYKKTEDVKNKRVRIQSIDVLGIGRCVDNCSITSRQSASEIFGKVAINTDVNTKYFCLTEASFVAAATIGFHSIGAITKNM